MNSYSTVYIVQNNNQNYSNAHAYGKIHFLTTLEYEDSEDFPDKKKYVLEEIRESLKNFDYRTDYLMLSGNPVSIGYAFHFVMSRIEGNEDGVLRYLRWDRKWNRYEVEVFDPNV